VVCLYSIVLYCRVTARTMMPALRVVKVQHSNFYRHLFLRHGCHGRLSVPYTYIRRPIYQLDFLDLGHVRTNPPANPQPKTFPFPISYSYTTINTGTYIHIIHTTWQHLVMVPKRPSLPPTTMSSCLSNYF
jgi:hypothetical protein